MKETHFLPCVSIQEIAKHSGRTPRVRERGWGKHGTALRPLAHGRLDGDSEAHEACFCQQVPVHCHSVAADHAADTAEPLDALGQGRHLGAEEGRSRQNILGQPLTSCNRVGATQGKRVSLRGCRRRVSLCLVEQEDGQVLAPPSHSTKARSPFPDSIAETSQPGGDNHDQISRLVSDCAIAALRSANCLTKRAWRIAGKPVDSSTTGKQRNDKRHDLDPKLHSDDTNTHL